MPMNKPSFFRSTYDLAHLSAEELLLQLKYQKVTMYAVWYLVAMFAACYAAIVLQIHPDILACLPLLLAFSSKIVFYFHDKWNLRILLFLFLVFLSTSLLEYWGSQTNWVYHSNLFWLPNYERALFKSGVLGFSWMLIAYCTGVLVKRAIPSWNLVLRAVVGGAIMVSFGVLLDNFMLSRGLVLTEALALPNARYFTLFGLASMIQLYFQKQFLQIENVLAVVYLVLTFVSLWCLS